MPDNIVAQGKVLLQAVMSEVPTPARFLADLARLRTGGRFHAEAVALAERIGVNWRDVMIANMAYDLAMSSMGCSTIALATASGPVVARNMDWWPEHAVARASHLVHIVRGDQLVFASAGWPGSIGVVSGLSARGFAIILNAVQSPQGIDKLGYPVLLHIRRVLEDAMDFDAAVGLLCKQRLVAGCLLTVVGRKNHQRIVIERTPTRHAVRRPAGDEPIQTTNHYRAMNDMTDGVADLVEPMCTRYEALEEMFTEHDEGDEADDTRLLYALTDPAVIQEITAQHVIARPATNSMRLLVPRRLLEGGANTQCETEGYLPR